MSDSGSADENGELDANAKAELQQLPCLQFSGDQLEQLEEEDGGAGKHWSEASQSGVESSGEAFKVEDPDAKPDETDAAAEEVEYEPKPDTSFQTDQQNVDPNERQPAVRQNSSSTGHISGSRSNSKASTSRRDRKRKQNVVVQDDEDGHDSSREDVDANASGAGDEPGTIPIFTREFLMHNKQQEVNLRNLRKEINDVEDERGNLQKHLELLEQETSALRKELAESRQLSAQLERAQDLIVEEIAEALHSESVELPEIDLRSKPSRLLAARKYIRLCVSQATGTQLGDSDAEFVQILRRKLSGLVVSC